MFLFTLQPKVTHSLFLCLPCDTDLLLSLLFYLIDLKITSGVLFSTWQSLTWSSLFSFSFTECNRKIKTSFNRFESSFYVVTFSYLSQRFKVNKFLLWGCDASNNRKQEKNGAKTQISSSLCTKLNVFNTDFFFTQYYIVKMNTDQVPDRK